MSNLSLGAFRSKVPRAAATLQRGTQHGALSRQGTFPQDWLIIGLLALVGYGLNVFCFPLFAGVVQMLFGSVAVLIALEIFGLGAGVLVALVASLYTYALWHHPYAIGVFVLEPCVVYVLRRRTRNLVFADVAFWFMVGMPLTWIIYSYPLHFTPDETLLITFKNGVNGSLTALIASLVLLLPPLRHYRAQRNRLNPSRANASGEATQRIQLAEMPTEPSFALLLFNLLVGAAIIPALGLTLRHSWIEMESAELMARASVLSAADAIDDNLRTWAKDNHDALNALARSAATNPGEQVRRDALLLHDLHPDFAGFVVINLAAPRSAPQVLLAAETPLRQSVGKTGSVAVVDRRLSRSADLTNAAQRAIIQTDAALEVHDVSNNPVPVWALQTIIPDDAENGAPSGKVLVGLLRLDALQSSLYGVPTSASLRVAVLDGSNRILAALPSEGALKSESLDQFNEQEGQSDTFEDGTMRWWPRHLKLPPLQAWAASVFFTQRESNTQTPWRVLVQAPFRQQEAMLVHGFAINLGLILVLILGAMPLATLLSRRLNRPLEQLASVSTNLPRKLATQDTTPPEWPRGGMSEISHLVRNVQHMESALRANFNALEHARTEAVSLQREAEEANRLKDEFLAVLSHELRTPLVPIIGYADLLHMSVAGGAIEADVVSEAARIIERNARAQGALIEDLLDVSRIVAGKMTLKIGVVNLQRLLKESLETVSFKAQDRHIQLQFLAPDEVPPIIGDAARLQQVVQNLLNNALKFSPEGSEVTVRLEREAECARITIADQGRGIPPESLPYIFDRFRQVHHDHHTRDTGGLGLGLSIVKNLTELHGGTIEARSEGEGRGAQFVICLPLNLADADAYLSAYDESSESLEGFTADDIAAQLF